MADAATVPPLRFHTADANALSNIKSTNHAEIMRVWLPSVFVPPSIQKAKDDAALKSMEAYLKDKAKKIEQQSSRVTLLYIPDSDLAGHKAKEAYARRTVKNIKPGSVVADLFVHAFNLVMIVFPSLRDPGAPLIEVAFTIREQPLSPHLLVSDVAGLDTNAVIVHASRLE